MPVEALDLGGQKNALPLENSCITGSDFDDFCERRRLDGGEGIECAPNGNRPCSTKEKTRCDEENK